MIVIRAVCCVHSLWGLGLILEAPDEITKARPIGSMEPFLQYLTPQHFGLLLIVTSAIPFLVASLGGQKKHGLAIPITVLPQQLILFWGIFWAFIWFMEGKADFRTYLGLSWQSALAFWHAVDVYRIIREWMIETRIKAEMRRNDYR